MRFFTSHRRAHRTALSQEGKGKEEGEGVQPAKIMLKVGFHEKIEKV